MLGTTSSKNPIAAAVIIIYFSTLFSDLIIMKKWLSLRSLLGLKVYDATVYRGGFWGRCLGHEAPPS